MNTRIFSVDKVIALTVANFEEEKMRSKMLESSLGLIADFLLDLPSIILSTPIPPSKEMRASVTLDEREYVRKETLIWLDERDSKTSKKEGDLTSVSALPNNACKAVIPKDICWYCARIDKVKITSVTGL